jgi:hypothetical protein
MAEPIFDALRREISETQKQREKLGILKITFVTALLGFGSIKIDNFVSVYQVLYLAPLIALFFDLLVMGEHFSIRRMGVFLRLNSESQKEREYEDFVRNNRDRFFRLGSFGITALSYVAAMVLLKTAKGDIKLIEWFWFSLIFVVFIAAVLFGNRRLLKLDRLVESAKSGIAKLGEDAQVSIKLCNKTNLKGYISKISEDSFVVTNSKTKKGTQVNYEDVAQLKGENLDVTVWYAKAVSSKDMKYKGMSA